MPQTLFMLLKSYSNRTGASSENSQGESTVCKRKLTPHSTLPSIMEMAVHCVTHGSPTGKHDAQGVHTRFSTIGHSDEEAIAQY
jgi:hypothetical protein